MQALFLMQIQNLMSYFRGFDFLLFLGINSESNHSIIPTLQGLMLEMQNLKKEVEKLKEIVPKQKKFHCPFEECRDRRPLGSQKSLNGGYQHRFQLQIDPRESAIFQKNHVRVRVRGVKKLHVRVRVRDLKKFYVHVRVRVRNLTNFYVRVREFTFRRYV